MATRGATFRDILEHYYAGIDLGKMEEKPAPAAPDGEGPAAAQLWHNRSHESEEGITEQESNLRPDSHRLQRPARALRRSLHTDCVSRSGQPPSAETVDATRAEAWSGFPRTDI